MEWNLCNGMYGMKCIQWNGMECKYGMNEMECMGWNIWTTMDVWNEMYGTEYFNVCMEWMEWNIYNEMFVMECIYGINGVECMEWNVSMEWME